MDDLEATDMSFLPSEFRGDRERTLRAVEGRKNLAICVIMTSTTGLPDNVFPGRTPGEGRFRAERQRGVCM